MSARLFYAAGPGNVIEAHKNWAQGRNDPSQMSLTYSGQFADFCRDVGAEAYIVSSFGEKSVYRDGAFVLEHRPKPMAGAAGSRYHIAELLYALSLLATAIRFRANIAVVDSGSTHYFMLSLLRMAGIRVVVVLHNSLWPHGFPPTRLPLRLISYLDALFFRWAASATLGVSPECERQVRTLTGGKHGPLLQIRAQYRPEYFNDIPPPGDPSPFRIMYAGRIIRAKGVFDILQMAKTIEERAPDRVRWELCGSGPDLEELKLQHREMNLASVVTIRGWTSPADMRDVLIRSHLSIVPTRSNFPEGLAMTVAEAILAGRPVITNSVVPALELCRDACIEAQPDDIDSYVEAIMKLMDNPDEYQRLRKACPDAGQQFYDRTRGEAAVLKAVFEWLTNGQRKP
jgi:glycogen synthase